MRSWTCSPGRFAEYSKVLLVQTCRRREEDVGMRKTVRSCFQLIIISSALLLVVLVSYRATDFSFVSMHFRDQHVIASRWTKIDAMQSPNNESVQQNLTESRVPGSSATCSHPYGQILILMVADSNKFKDYADNVAGMSCYAKVHGYRFLAVTPEYNNTRECLKKNVIWSRHCLARRLLETTDWLLFLDGDVAVVNASKCVEDYIDPRAHVIHYMRFQSHEIAAGGYLVRNSDRGRAHLDAWMDFKPNQNANADNGALHLVLLREIEKDAGLADGTPALAYPNKSVFSANSTVRNVSGSNEGLMPPYSSRCERFYRKVKWPLGYANFVGCTITAFFKLSNSGRFGNKVKILRRGQGWMRENWITSNRWHDLDFLLHAVKKRREIYTRTPKEAECVAGWQPSIPPSRHFRDVGQARDAIVEADKRTRVNYITLHKNDMWKPEPDISPCWPRCQSLPGTIPESSGTWR